MDSRAIFDEAHGQPCWEATGFAARTLHGSYEALGIEVGRRGLVCTPSSDRITPELLRDASLLVLPPAVGELDLVTSVWCPRDESYYSGAELGALLDYVHSGGRLLGFGYRLGDRFTKANTAELFAALGCVLPDEMVVSVSAPFSQEGVLHTFETDGTCFVEGWARKGVSRVAWRAVAPLFPIPGGPVRVVTLSGGQCARLRWPGHRFTFEPAPIAVCGSFGHGRFLLLGGPQVFESGPHGLIETSDNLRFARNTLDWLLSDRGGDAMVTTGTGAHSERRSDLLSMLAGGANPREKGLLLSEFVRSLMSEAPFLDLVGCEQWSLDREAEFDLVFQCSSANPLWGPSAGIVPVECKNHRKPIGAGEISRFADKLARLPGRLGFFAGRCFTDKAWSTVKQSRLVSRLTIGLLTDDDYSEYLNGRSSAEALLNASLIRSLLL